MEVEDMYNNSETIQDGGDVYDFLDNLVLDNITSMKIEEIIVDDILANILNNSGIDVDEEDLEEFKSNIKIELEDEFLQYELDLCEFLKSMFIEIIDENKDEFIGVQD